MRFRAEGVKQVSRAATKTRLQCHHESAQNCETTQVQRQNSERLPDHRQITHNRAKPMQAGNVFLHDSDNQALNHIDTPLALHQESSAEFLLQSTHWLLLDKYLILNNRWKEFSLSLISVRKAANILTI